MSSNLGKRIARNLVGLHYVKSQKLWECSKCPPSTQSDNELQHANIYHRFSDKFTNARFYKLDVDDVPDVAQELGIRAMPTFLLFKDGEKVAEVVGANPKALEAAIEKNYE
jgi:thiol-disulfide isomerase/thioredoxin